MISRVVVFLIALMVPTAAIYLPAESASHHGELESYVETIPGSSVSFELVKIPGGTFQMGTPESDALREEDEGPPHEVEVGPFWMARTEVTWDEYEEFYFGGVPSDLPEVEQGRVDAVSRPTPPYIPPDLGWGTGKRPAMSMTFYAAQKYCEWLSALTGKKYRLPTEAEWEYACSAGGLWVPENLDEHVVYEATSEGMTQEAGSRKPNPWGLFDMLGNVSEFCSDWYAADYYAGSPKENPTGPHEGEHHAIRGGTYFDPVEEMRCTNRNHTTWDDCMITDPQIPKSEWWYSDCWYIGFRVVRSAQ
ncbi:MAG: formylglycine-generating enzyme family protein [Acidobacteriota bacterium]